MTKSKKKAQKPKQQPKKQKSNARRMVSGSGMSSNLSKVVCSISNPFCPEANGAKLPDPNTTRSLTYQNRQVIPIATEIDGEFGYFFNPNAFSTYTPAVLAGSTGTISAWGSGSSSTFWSTIGTSIGSYRVVSWGLKYKTSQAWTSATGLMIVSEINGDPRLTTGQSINSLQLGTVGEYYPIRDADLYFIGRPTGMASQEYVAGSTSNVLPWTGCMITGTGTASTTVGYVELVINYEWLPINNTGYVTASTAAASNNSVAMDTRAKLFEGVSTIARYTPNHDKQWMMKAGSSLLKTLAGSAVGYLRGGAVGAIRGGSMAMLTNGPIDVD